MTVDDKRMLEYMQQLHARILIELGFTDQEIDAHRDAGSDPFDVVIQRIRDLKQSSKATKH